MELNDEKTLIIDSSLCTGRLIFYPLILNIVNPFEYKYVLQNKDSISSADFRYFMEANLINEPIRKVYINSEKEIFKIEEISIDLRIDFGERISTSYYRGNKLALYYKYYCSQNKKIKILRAFYYEGREIIKEVFILAEKNNITIKKLDR